MRGHISLVDQMHILWGDCDGGGGGHHAEADVSGKARFPSDWDCERILSTISEIARNPEHCEERVGGRGEVCTSTRDGVTISVVTNTDGSVRTAYPVPGPRVVTR
ncbi:EndoU domain-containing protein [Glycomyces terrestris]|uniref:Bacterial EndoU nuclease domain-containing protein n=1 Tax=Glycomyces terrestris TaxID=2493553 RepID=A0A426URI9_9ACTN|nr:hypothetical protein EIW28_23940 [Glycomyces terrestris]